MARYYEVSRSEDRNSDSTKVWKIWRILADASMVMIPIILILTWAFGIHRINVDAGHEAVLVMKPYFFGRGGVAPTPVTTGSQWVAMTTEGVQYPVVSTEYPESFKDMNTSDNFPVDFETNLQLQILPGQGPKLISIAGPAWYNNNIKQKYREIVRDEIGKYAMTPLVVRGKVLDDAQKSIENATRAYIQSVGFNVVLKRITFSKINPDDKILDERAKTGAEQQRIQSEGQRKLAEDGRKLAEESRALADKAYADKMGLSPDQFVRLESIKAGERMVMECVKSGKGGCNILVGAGANAQPMMTLK